MTDGSGVMIVTIGEDGARIVIPGEDIATMGILIGIGIRMGITTAMVVFIGPATTGTERIPSNRAANDAARSLRMSAN